MKSQTDEVLAYMQEVGPLTPLDALRELGCFRLGARIWELKRRGVVVYDKWKEHTGFKGRTVRFKQYGIAPFAEG